MYKKSFRNLILISLTTSFCGAYLNAEQNDTAPKFELRELIKIERATPLIDVRPRVETKTESYTAAIVQLNNELEISFQSQLAVEEENKRLRALLLNLHNRLNNTTKKAEK